MRARGLRRGALALLVAAATGGAVLVPRVAGIGAAYYAKTLCSGLFVAQRTEQDLLAADLVVDELWPLQGVAATVDHAAARIDARFLAIGKAYAVHRPGYGCELNGRTEGAAPQGSSVSGPWPVPFPKEASRVRLSLPGRLEAAVEQAFDEPDPARAARTRAVVIAHRGRIIAERYAPGFDAETRLIGWSLTKSVLNAWLGVLVQRGEFDLADASLLVDWRDEGRRAITLADLLQMSSGLKFGEQYRFYWSDVIQMLLFEPDTAGFAADKPRRKPRWSYSSGTSNILSGVIRERFADDARYWSAPRRLLFEPLGMSSAVMERDAAGNFVASSFMYATARDWARFGTLYLLDGVWNGTRLLPQGWVEFTSSPAPLAEDGCYGAHFWRCVPDHYTQPDAPPDLPDDIFHAIGFEGQFVTVVPSHQLVIVRLGLSRRAHAWDHPGFVANVLSAFETSGSP